MINKLNKIIYGLIIILFGWVFISSLIFASSQFNKINKVYSLLICIIIIIIWYFIYKLINKKIPESVNKKIKYLTFVVYLVIISIIEIIIVNNLNVNPGWDFEVVFSTAKSLANNGILSLIPNYFRYYPNNIFILLCETICIRMGNIVSIDPMNVMYFINITLINLSLLIFYLYLYKQKGYHQAIFGLILTLFFMPIFLYSPIFYTDTFSIFMPIVFLFLFSLIKPNNKNNVYIWMLIGILLFLAKEIKITSLIILIPLIIDFLIHYHKKRDLLGVFIIIVSFFCLNLSYNKLVLSHLNIEDNNNYGAYPVTHWLMMGIEDIDANDYLKLNAVGGYNGFDFDNSRAQLTHEATISYNLSEYKNRVSKLGYNGYFNYLSRKVTQTWSDGYYFSDIALSIKNNNSEMYQFLFKNQPSKDVFLHISSGIQFALLFCIILSAIFNLNKKNKNLAIGHLTLIGLLIFFVFWENRSRYLYNYIPIFILIIINFYDIINIHEIKNMNFI